MLKRKPRAIQKVGEEKSSTKLPAKLPKGEIFLKAILDQKFNVFGIELREEFDRQMTSVNAELRDVIFRERNDRKKANVLILGFLSIVVILLIGNIFFVVNTTDSSVKSAVTKEFAFFEAKNKENTKSLFMPIQETVERKLLQVSNELSLSRGYIDVFALEGLARNGSRAAFEELIKTVNRGGAKGAFAENKLKELKKTYSILAEPKKEHITLGDLSVVRGAQTTSAESLSVDELIYVLNSPNATLSQIHQILTLLWNQTLTRDHEIDLLSILKNSRNLPAVVATCSLLQKNFGNQATIYDFTPWRTFLESRM